MAEPWAQRIPAAMALAEGLIRKHGMLTSLVSEAHVMSSTEVALAEGLWGFWHEQWEFWPEEIENVPPALRAFCEKVEGL